MDHDQYETAVQEHEALYLMIKAACYLLPVPINLPSAGVEQAERMKALSRVASIVDQQPMPEEQYGELGNACLNWMIAADLLRFEAEDREPSVWHRVVAVRALIMEGVDAVKRLGDWLADQM
ncbi:hypothetical protein [Wenjunlia vitaminophila]|uniref:hypothetical protein n=1 Tax=Wenjunlia vitaminophila TaxID=76728 RepID=UPI000379025A|nr:hypothetical protein [Wenjunlia vitaminophila]